MPDSNVTTLGPRFQEALAMAANLHAAQKRKMTGVPYISHLLSVTALVLQGGGDEDEAIAALLHDAAEDQGGEQTLAVIREKFGDKVADIVASCSDTFVSPKPPWRERKQDHIEHLRGASPAVHRVVLADKLHNARSLLRDLRENGGEMWDFFKGGKEGTLWYFNSLYEVLSETCEGYLLEELGRVIVQIEELAGEQD